MMRTPNAFAVAVRTPSGKLALMKEGLEPCGWMRLTRWPVARGFGVLVQAVGLGVRALNFSAVAALDPAVTVTETWQRRVGVGMSAAVAAGLSVGLFFFLPLYLTRLAASVLAPLGNWLLFNLADGAIRVALFLAYLFGISRMGDVRRLFQYHGAEHKVVHNWEAGMELSVNNARRFSRLHPRCGTSFLMFVMLVSVALFSLFRFGSFAGLFLSRLALLPVVSGISYELIRLSARNSGNWLLRPLMKPGLWLQGITTREPSDDQLDVAICALREALVIEEARRAA